MTPAVIHPFQSVDPPLQRILHYNHQPGAQPNIVRHKYCDNMLVHAHASQKSSKFTVYVLSIFYKIPALS